MQQASCLEGGPLLWIWPLYLHVNQKSDDDDDDDGIRVMELTRKVNGRTDGQTDRWMDRQMDGGHDTIRLVFDELTKIDYGCALCVPNV